MSLGYIFKNCTSPKLARLLETASKSALFSIQKVKKLIKKTKLHKK